MNKYFWRKCGGNIVYRHTWDVGINYYGEDIFVLTKDKCEALLKLLIMDEVIELDEKEKIINEKM